MMGLGSWDRGLVDLGNLFHLWYNMILSDGVSHPSNPISRFSKQDSTCLEELEDGFDM